MRWRGRQRSSNIEDRRGAGGGFRGGFGRGPAGFGRGPVIRIPMGRGGAGGIGFIIVVLIIAAVLGINPLSLLDGSYEGGGAGSSYSTARPGADAGQDELVNFVSVVARENETMWGDWFARAGESYTPPKVVLFSQQTETGCGMALLASGPFYCPEDQDVYIDLSFYDQLRRQFGAPGDFAQAYVIAHEVGHHVQNMLGVLGQFQRARQGLTTDQANALSVRVELQADCYAGVWANYVGQENILDNGDIEEAINAANQIGDDTLQREYQGRVQPRSFTHGTSAQRMKWFRTGYQSGDPAACDTFGGAV